MFTLRDYVSALLDITLKEKNVEKRQASIDGWIELMKSHNRILEIPKALEIVESEIEKRKEKAVCKVSNEKNKEELQKYFKSLGIESIIEVDPRILGGVKIVWKNVLYDNTLETKIKTFEKKVSR